MSTDTELSPEVFNCPNCGAPMFTSNSCPKCGHNDLIGTVCHCDYCVDEQYDEEVPMTDFVKGARVRLNEAGRGARCFRAKYHDMTGEVASTGPFSVTTSGDCHPPPEELGQLCTTVQWPGRKTKDTINLGFLELAP